MIVSSDTFAYVTSACLVVILMKIAVEVNRVSIIAVKIHVKKILVDLMHFVLLSINELVVHVHQEWCQVHQRKLLVYDHQLYHVQKIVIVLMAHHVSMISVVQFVLTMQDVLTMKGVIVELVSLFAGKMTIVEVVKFVKVKSAQLDVDQTQVVLITCRALINVVLIHVKIQLLVEVMQRVLPKIINQNVHVKRRLLEIHQLAVDFHYCLVKNTLIVQKVKLVTEMNAEHHAEMIKIVSLMRNVFVEHAELFAAKTANVEMNLYAKIEFVKLDAELIILVQRLNRVSINNVPIHVPFSVNVDRVLNVVFIIMVFNVVARKE